MKSADFFYDAPAFNADLFYATGFDSHDTKIPFFRQNGKKYLMLSDLELDRGKKEANVEKIYSFSEYSARAKEKKGNPGLSDIVGTLLKERGVEKLIIPESTPYKLVTELKRSGFAIETRARPFYPERLRKNPAEKGAILESQKIVFRAMKLAEGIIGKSSVKNGFLYFQRRRLTSERLKSIIREFLGRKNFETPHGFILSSGESSIDPHFAGKGPIKAGEPIIVDIFGRSLKTRFWGDATRTFCKKSAPPELKRLYNTVKEAQLCLIEKIKPGVNGKKLDAWARDFFKGKGYPTGKIGGRMQGFFHGTGHGVGLEIHEGPVGIKAVDYYFEEGVVTSVEPGLYYKGLGGVRIEDLVYVTKTGCEVIGRYRKHLVIS